VKRLVILDVVRFLLSVLVVLYHVPKQYSLGIISDLGGYAVVGFFVMSGFVIQYSYGNSRKIGNFFLKRFFRLYPLLLLTTLAEIFVLIFYELYKGVNLLSLNNILETVLMLNSTPLLGISYGLNPPSWSLSAEMISYIFFGLLIYVDLNKGYLLVLISILLFMFTGNVGFHNPSTYGFIGCLITFTIGAGFKLINSYYFKISIICFIFLWGVYDKNNYFFAISLILIFIFLTEIKISSSTFSFISKYLGELSFPVYMSHSLVLFITAGVTYGNTSIYVYYLIYFVLLYFVSYGLLKFDRFVQNYFRRTISK